MRKLLLASAAAIGASLTVAGGAQAQPVKPTVPGTLVVHLNGYLQFEIGGYGSTFNRVNTAAGPYKLNDITTDGDARIYPGFDAATANGLDYGVQIETRVTTSNAGRPVGSNGASNSLGVTNGSSSVYIRRAYGYIGAPKAGFLRFGQGDGSFSLLQSGVVEAFGDGAQWNDDGGPVQFLPTNALPGQFIYGDQGNLYATDKIVYLTPAFSGFSGGVSYEPNSNGLREGYANNAAASSTSAALTSSPVPGDIGTRRRNTVDAMVQYSLKSDGYIVKASGGYLYGAPISYSGPATAVGTPTHFGYDNLGVYQAGAQVTFAGLTVGGNIKGGEVEDGYAFKPRGGRNGFGYSVGADYVIGPYVVGASFFNNQSSGAFVPGTKKPIARTLSEYGVAAGGNIVVAKTLSLFVQYLYGHRKQIGNTTLNANGNAQVQLIAAGATFKW